MKFSAPRGTKDILPEEAAAWRWLEDVFVRQCYLYGFREIRIPIFEEAEIYSRSTGEETEIVTKQMYLFTDRGGRNLALRPEGTPGVVRAYLQSGLANQGGVQRLFYFGPFFRYERPQAGRFRQFHQAGVEFFGAASPQADAEVITLAIDFLKALGLEGANLRINSTGCKDCRPAYQEALRKALAPVVDKLCEWCQERYKGNTLRILDEKRPDCRQHFGNLPSILDYLCDGCREHFDGLRSHLDSRRIPYEIDSGIVRGLDYYTRTVFEINQPGIGAQDALIGGGRYDDMVEEFGGKPTPAVGWAGGVERILSAMDSETQLAARIGPLIYVAFVGDAVGSAATCMLQELRSAGLPAVSSPLGRSLKAQMKEAAGRGSRWVVIIGEDEVAADTVTLRDMETGEQQSIKREELVEELKKRMERKTT
jgi:histidyl-tRNA synthetase